MANPGIDLLCISPHTDDAEIALGGTLRALADRGRAVWVCDLTRGELATNAEPDERWEESQRASALLGLAGRVQLSLPDGFLDPHDRAHAEAVVWVLRRLRPRWVVAAPEPRRHPDHLATPDLVRRAAFLARLRNLAASPPAARWWPDDPGGEAADTWIADVVGTVCAGDDEPDLYFDVSGAWDAKLAALDCYASQLQRNAGRHATAINDPDFRSRIDQDARRWGRRAGVLRAEALRVQARPVFADLPTERWA